MNPQMQGDEKKDSGQNSESKEEIWRIALVLWISAVAFLLLGIVLPFDILVPISDLSRMMALAVLVPAGKLILPKALESS